MLRVIDSNRRKIQNSLIKNEIYTNNLTINQKALRINQNEKKIMNYNDKNIEMNHNNNLISNNKNEDATE